MYYTYLNVFSFKIFFFIGYDILILSPWKPFHYFLVNFDSKFTLIVRLICFFDISVLSLLFS